MNKEQIKEFKKRISNFDEINQLFEINSIELSEGDNELLLIVRKINDRIELNIKIIEDLLQPEGNMASYYELNEFDESDKKNLENIYIKLMKLNREAILCIIDNDENRTKKYIQNTFEGYKNIKTNMILILEKMKKCWKSYISRDKKLEYMG